LIQLRASDEDLRRLGITVTKQVAGAVGRNRIKRLVREVFRQEPELFPPRAEVVVVAKREAAPSGYDAVRQELLRARDSMAAALRGPTRSPRRGEK
jgi:ribonuclease P protein component